MERRSRARRAPRAICEVARARPHPAEVESIALDPAPVKERAEGPANIATTEIAYAAERFEHPSERRMGFRSWDER